MEKFIAEILNCEEKAIKEIRDCFADTARSMYRDYIFQHCGHLYEEDIIVECIERIIMYAGQFRGNSFKEFKSYNEKIIRSIIFKYVKDVIKLDKLNFINCEEEHELEYVMDKYSRSYEIEDAVINKILLDNFIEKVELSRRERELIDSFKRYGSIRDCCEEGVLNYNAAKQMLYRIRVKIKKKMGECGIYE